MTVADVLANSQQPICWWRGGGAGLAYTARDREEPSWVRVPAAAFFASRNILEQDIRIKGT